MKYYSFTFLLKESWQQEILIAELDAIGFEGFEEKQEELVAFISVNEFHEKKFLSLIESAQQLFPVSFSQALIAEQNWNALWESNFKPIIIGNDIAVRASFHNPFPGVKYEIVIDPKMSFGTGHHATTGMMMQMMLAVNFKNKSVLDFGSGTGILSILAAKLGASAVLAIDNEEWAYRNSAENFQLNNVTSVTSVFGDALNFKGNQYDVILANINRMVILDTMQQFSASLPKHAMLIISGFLKEDEEIIDKSARNEGLGIVNQYEEAGWLAMILKPLSKE